MKNRSELRNIIIKILYQVNIYKDSNISYDLDDVIKEQLEIDNNFVRESIDGVFSHQDEIISLSNKYLKNWDYSRLSKVDQAILSLAIYELMWSDVPSLVAINEAIELAKKYSDDPVVKMINGVLDKIYHEELKEE